MSGEVGDVLQNIESIGFRLMGPEDIIGDSVAEITYDGAPHNWDHFPIENGVLDRRMGTTEPALSCLTCGKKPDRCPGHFGHIDLAKPVHHVGFVDDILYFLKSTCGGCGRILMKESVAQEYLDKLSTVPEGEIQKVLKDIKKHLADSYKNNRTCSRCGTRNSEMFYTSENLTFYLGRKKERDDADPLDNSKILTWLENISDSDSFLLGISPQVGWKANQEGAVPVARPEWMILTALPVPPVSMRPSVTLESGDRTEDGLTHLLVNIVRANNLLKENMLEHAGPVIVADMWMGLQINVAQYINNSPTTKYKNALDRSGRPYPGLYQRLKGKEGIFRKHLSGKRVNFSARTVVTPDPFLSINEIGIPYKFVDPSHREEPHKVATGKLTVPCHIKEHNLDHCRKLIEAGADSYPGAVKFLSKTGKNKTLNSPESIEWAIENLEPGCVIDRYLQDGDVVLFNRQPSLHRQSVMAHRVRIIEGNTFTFNVAVCEPYGADFDGDEMNVHVLQSEAARGEALALMLVQENILSPRYGASFMGCIHDQIAGMFYLTKGDMLYDGDQTGFLFSRMGKELPPPTLHDEKGTPMWSGKDIFSSTLPKGLNATFKSKIYAADKDERWNKEYNDAVVEIINGKLISGTIDKSAIGGGGSGVLVEKVARLFGNQEAARFLNDITKLGIAVVTLQGFSTGIADYDLSPDAYDRINEIMVEADEKVSEIQSSFAKGEVEPDPGFSLKETEENRVLAILSQQENLVEQLVMAELDLDNSAMVMARTGARGKPGDLKNMAGVVGQQRIRGGRIHRGYESRTLSHFKKEEESPEACGFVRSSYKKGLDPLEYFFHSMGSREGMVDTAVRTAKIGYMGRRLVASMEDLVVQEDLSVKNSKGTLFQPTYGEDGIDPVKSGNGRGINVAELVFDIIEEDE